MIPLVRVSDVHNMFPLDRDLNCSQLHDLGTGDLALRIGGSRTGLLNASMVRRGAQDQSIYIANVLIRAI